MLGKRRIPSKVGPTLIALHRKSQIAIEYAYQVRDKFPDTWVFWVHAGTRARFEEGYRRIAEATKIEGWNDPKADILRLVRSWLCDQSDSRWVIIVDNADDWSVFLHSTSQSREEDLPDDSPELLSDYLPQASNGSILITSRSQDVAYRLTGSRGSIVEVMPMDESDGLSLLQKKLSVETDKEEELELLKALDYMPLAISQAAAFIEQRAPRMTISRYLNDVRKSEEDRARLLKQDVGDSRRDGRASNSIIATWQISFEYIRQEVPRAARLLSLMSLFDRQGIPESILQSHYEIEYEDELANFEDDIYTLMSFSLVKMSTDSKQFEMHRLVQLSTKKWLELRHELENWKEKYAILLNYNYPTNTYYNWAECQALFPHVQAAVGCRPASEEPLEEWANVLYKASRYASEMGQFNIAQEMDRNALETREIILGLEHPKTLSTACNLGWVLYKQGKYQEAEVMQRQTLERQEMVLGPEHLDTLLSLNNLGLLLDSQGKYQEAEVAHKKTLAGYTKLLGPDHLYTLISLNNLALALGAQGKYREAEEMHRRNLEGIKKMLGDEHPDTLIGIANLGLVLEKQGKSQEAEAMHRQALAARQRVFGVEHLDTLSSLDCLGSVLVSQGKYQEAEKMHRRSLEETKKQLGDEHPDTLGSLSNLGVVLEKQGKFQEAEAIHQQTLEVREKVLGVEHPDTFTSVSSLGKALNDQGKHQEAETVHRRALEGRERILGAEHPGTLLSKRYLASTFYNQGRLKEAEDIQVGLMEMKKKILGNEHPDTLSVMADLALTYKAQGRSKKAMSLMEDCCLLRKRILGSHHPYTEFSVKRLNEWRMEGLETGL